MSEDNGPQSCPLCMEAMDEFEQAFIPCECGYQVMDSLISLGELGNWGIGDGWTPPSQKRLDLIFFFFSFFFLLLFFLLDLPVLL